MRILIVEDDAKLCGLVARGLTEDGHVVDSEHDGISGQEAARAGEYDVIVLDIMLPRKSGLDLVRDIRAMGVQTPVLMLTARDTTEDVVVGLDAGADDYLRKPFSFDELAARIRTLARRGAVPPRAMLRVGDLSFDLSSKRVVRGERVLEFTGRELAYLEYFMKHAGRIVTRRMLEAALWDRDAEILSNVVEVYVGRLRSKLDKDGMPRLLTTVRGVGYRFGPP